MPAPNDHVVELGGHDGVARNPGVELYDHHLFGAVRRNGLHHAQSVLPYERGVVEIEFRRRIALDSLDGQRAARSHDVAVGGIGCDRDLDDRQRRFELRRAVVVVGDGHRQRERRGESGRSRHLDLARTLVRTPFARGAPTRRGGQGHVRSDRGRADARHRKGQFERTAGFGGHRLDVGAQRDGEFLRSPHGQ